MKCQGDQPKMNKRAKYACTFYLTFSLQLFISRFIPYRGHHFFVKRNRQVKQPCYYYRLLALPAD